MEAEPPPPPKRRKLRACDSCRHRKIRCDNLPGSCRNCQTYGIECRISRHQQATSTRPSSSSANFHQFRVGRQSPGRPASIFVPPEQHPALPSSVAPSPPPIPLAQAIPQPSSRQETDPELDVVVSPSFSRRSDTLQGVVTTEVGVFPKNSKFAGMSSAHVLAKTAEELFKSRAPYINVMEFLCPAMSFAEEFSSSSQLQNSLLPQATAHKCIERYTQSFGLLLPILEAKDLEKDYQALYNGEDLEPGPMACVMLAIALGSNKESVFDHQFRAVHNISMLLTAHPYMASVQAFLLMTVCWMNIGKEGQAFLSLGTAIRIAQSIGLHRSLSAHHHAHEFNFVLREHSLRSRLWWICYCLDKKLSFEGGRPSAISDENCDVDIPQDIPVTSPASNSSKDHSPFIFIHHLTTISQLLSKISSSLFNINTSFLTEEELVTRIAAADSTLISWAKSLPSEIDPDRELAGVQDELTRVAASLLHCIYFNALLTIHRASLISRKPSRFMTNHSNPRIVASSDICLMAARSLARSVNTLVIEKRQIQSPRWVGHYPVNSVMALFIGSMHSPTKWSCATDMALMNSLAYCFRLSEDKAAATRFEILMGSLQKAVENAALIADQIRSREASAPARPKAVNNGPDEGTKRDQCDGSTYGGNKPSGEMSNHDLGGINSVDAQNARPSDTFSDDNQMYGLDDQFNFEDLFGDYPSLWNMQLWPVANLESSLIHDLHGGSIDL